MTRSRIDALGLEPGGCKSEPSESYDTFEPTTVPDAPTPGCDSRKPRLTCLPRKARAALTEYHITVEKSAAASRDCGTIPHSSTERPWRKEEWLSCYHRSTATLTAEEWAEIWEGFLVED